MSRVALKPGKRLRHEILSLVPLIVLIGAVFLSFPFKPDKAQSKGRIPGSSDGSSCVFVELTSDEELKAMDIIRAAISTDVGSIRDLRADLSLSTIPEKEYSFVMGFNDRRCRTELSKPSIEIVTIPKSREADPPGQIPVGPKQKEENTFSKEEMLKLID